MVLRYVLQLLFSEICKIAKNSTTTKAREKITTDLESLELISNLNLKTSKSNLIKLATDFYCQPSYLFTE